MCSYQYILFLILLLFSHQLLFVVGFAGTVSVSSNKEIRLNTLSVKDLHFDTLHGRLIPTLGSRKNPAISCSELLEYVPPVDGIYWLMPASGNAAEAYQAFCDMTTDGGGWTLLFKIGQKNSKAGGLSDEVYERVAYQAQWIYGINVTAPLDLALSTPENTAALHSLDWRNLFTDPGKPYQLRQTFGRADGSRVFDALFDVEFSGYFLQNDAPTEKDKVWPLRNRRVLKDSSGVSWSTLSGENMYFWTPFTGNTAFGTLLFTGCSTFLYDAYCCGFFNEKTHLSNLLGGRRPGSAGIVVESSERLETAASWLPLFSSSQDILYLHIATDVFGQTGASMLGMYWVREV